MIAAAILAVSVLRTLDPYTSVYQTDDALEGAQLAQEPGYWPVPQGLVDPLASKLQPRVIHTVFRVSEKPAPESSPEKPSPLFKVNQVGYLPDAPKFAYLGAWLGPVLGPWKPRWGQGSGDRSQESGDRSQGSGDRSQGAGDRSQESGDSGQGAVKWELVDAATGNAVYESREYPLLRVPDDTTKEGAPFTGEETYEMDFSSVTNEGTYFVRVQGVGRSAEFRIAASAAEDAFRVHMLGLYQKRCGIAKCEPYTHWTAGACHSEAVRGSFPPDEGKLEPKAKWFEIIRDNTDWKGGERLRVVGGWHDAADYDRRPMHLNIVNDLCAVYLMRPQNFRDGQLAIPEGSNGIPDILDEAEWGLRHLLAVQQKDGGVGTWIETTGHPGPGNVAEKDDMPYAVSRATRKSSLMYAAHAALLARCRDEFRGKYLESARRAWDFAMREAPRSETFFIKKTSGRVFKKAEVSGVRWTEDKNLPTAYLVKAAVNLHALTGEARYLEPVERDLKRLAEDLGKNAWNLIPLLFAGERALGLPDSLTEIFKRWEKSRLNAAKGICAQVETAYAYRAPWWHPRQGWCHAMGFGHSHPLVRAQYLMAAHQITGERRYLDAITLSADFHNGCNPQGATLTSGLGEVYPVAFLDLPSYVDGIAEYVPGISPYRWTYAMPAKAVEMVWKGDRQKASKWPIWRRWGNLENQTVAASEYTVWETIAPAASVMGYLVDPNAKTQPQPLRKPAARLSDLPGYWMLP